MVISSANNVSQVGQLNYSSTKVADALLPMMAIGEYPTRGIKNLRCVAIAPRYAAPPILTGMNQDRLKVIINGHAY